MSNVDDFLGTLVITNKTYEFFTHWQKARGNQALYKDELALLGVLTGTKSPRDELRRLLLKYPRINSLIPLLSAIRISGASHNLFILDSQSAKTIEYYFGDKNVNDDVATKTIEFAERSGLLQELVNVKNHSDFYFGVEVGLDTNGRKNRSGTAMEALVEPYVRDFTEKHKGQYVTQTNFEKAAKIFNVSTPPNQSNKRGDFMLLVDNKPYNIETNFFDGGGSKQEVINSYISRSQDLAAAGWGFGIVTDGLGWRKNRAQVEHAYKTIHNVYNLVMCENGKLETILKR